ncbi:MAG: 3-oxoadipate enol-lactonase [Gammaproteobacteria bacterium]|jgi:3-oxoadipate enol-lactonase
MDLFRIGDQLIHYRVEGDPNGFPVVFANSLGTDFRLWDQLIPLLPSGLRILRFDKRGHGLSSCPDSDYSIDDLVNDCASLMRSEGFEKSLFIGLSIGGLIAQGLAVKAPDLVRAIVISNSAAKIGTSEMWQDRIGVLQEHGIEALADSIMERWFSRQFHKNRSDELKGWRSMLTRTPLQGYIGCSKAIAHSDFHQSTATLTLPAMAIAGSEDGSTPPTVVKACADLIEGCHYVEIQGAGHLPCVEQPQVYANHLIQFMGDIDFV